MPYNIIGTEIQTLDGKLLEKHATRAAAMARAREMAAAEGKGLAPPKPPPAKMLTELPWKAPLQVRPRGDFGATWTADLGYVLHPGAAAMTPLPRVEFEAKYRRKDGEPFGEKGSADVLHAAEFEAVRSDKPIVGPDATLHQGTSYVVRLADGEFQVFSERQFRDAWEVIQSAKKGSEK